MLSIEVWRRVRSRPDASSSRTTPRAIDNRQTNVDRQFNQASAQATKLMNSLRQGLCLATRFRH